MVALDSLKNDTSFSHELLAGTAIMFTTLATALSVLSALATLATLSTLPHRCQVRKVTERPLRVEGLDDVYVEVKVRNQVLHDANQSRMLLKNIDLVVCVVGVVCQLEQGVLRMGHTVQGAVGVGLLNMRVLDSDNASYVFHLVTCPLHDSFRRHIVLVRRCH